jgi:hypothetical protein
MELSPRDSGVYAKCDCGSRLYVPITSVKKIPVLFCPCGEIHKIPHTVINDMQKRLFRHHIRRELGHDIKKSRQLTGGKAQERRSP